MVDLRDRFEGRFVWYELVTTNMAAAKAFYSEVVGWGTQDASTASMAYTLCAAGGAAVCGLMELSQSARKSGFRPSWLGYVGVSDVDAATSRFEQLGGDTLVVRLGGMYGLERVINTSQQYHRAVLEVLSAFVRSGTRTATGDGPPGTDIQAALTVIGSRAAIETGVIDLNGARIQNADLANAELLRPYWTIRY